MPKSYQHINKYEKEILELNAQGLTRKEIGQNLDSLKSKHTISLHDITKSKEI